MQPHHFALAALGVALGLSLGGCSSNVDAKIALAGLSSKCRINSDCSAELVCAFQRCHEQCSSSRDCERGSRCVTGVGSRNVCQLEDEAGCGKTGACAGAEVCGVDGTCRDTCSSDQACLSEQVCRAGTCADAAELDAQGQLTPAPDRPATAPTPCALDSDCPARLVCAAGRCVTQCQSEADCQSGQRCDEGRCITPVASTSGCLRNSDCNVNEACVAGACQALPPPPPKPECNYNSDCNKPGQHCQNGACRCECQTSADCAPTQQCQDSCQCVAGRVLQGNVTVANDRQLAALADVVTITGQLSITIPGYGEYHLPSLRHVGAFVGSGQKATLVADALEDVKGAFSCFEVCRAPQLKRAGSITINSQVMPTLELPALTMCGDFSVFYSALTSVSAPQLETVGVLRLEGNGKLTRLDMPKLATLTNVTLGMDDRLAELSLPLAAPSQAIAISNMNALETISLPATSSLANDVTLNQNPKLKKLDLSGLEQGRFITLTQLPMLSELSLSKLAKLSGSFQLQASSGPGVLAFPRLESAQAVILGNVTQVASIEAPLLGTLNELTLIGTQLTSLSLPVTQINTSLELKNCTQLTTLDLSALQVVGTVLIDTTKLTSLDSITPERGGALESAGVFTIINNPALPVCAMNALSSALQAKGWNNGLVQQGNLDCACSDGESGATCQ